MDFPKTASYALSFLLQYFWQEGVILCTQIMMMISGAFEDDSDIDDDYDKAAINNFANQGKRCGFSQPQNALTITFLSFQTFSFATKAFAVYISIISRVSLQCI